MFKRGVREGFKQVLGRVHGSWGLWAQMGSIPLGGGGGGGAAGNVDGLPKTLTRTP